jgi:hypothetical protein
VIITWSGQFIGDDLVAQTQALGADSGRSPSPARLGRPGGQTGDKTAMLAAEAALRQAVLLRYGVHWPEPGSSGAARANHALGKPDARVADVAARARDQLADLVLRLAAERASQVDARGAHPVLAARTASSLDQLIKLLVAEPQRGSDVLRPRAAYDQMVHRTAELGPGRLGCLLGLGQPLLGLPGLGQQLLIHTATVARPWSTQVIANADCRHEQPATAATATSAADG